LKEKIRRLQFSLLANSALAMTLAAANVFFPLSSFLFMEKAQAQSAAPQASGKRIFTPYEDEPKFVPARPSQIILETKPSRSSTRLRREELNPNAQAPDTASSDSDLQMPLNPDSVALPTPNPTLKPTPLPDLVQPFNLSPDGTPALNIVPTPDRPPIPPPAKVPPLTPMGNGIARPPQAWRVKAYQLFKQKPDATSFALDLNASYATAVTELRRAVEDAGLTVSGFNPTSGHVLITFSDIASNRTEKSIIALRPGLNQSGGGSANSTEIRVLCEARNRSLTQARLKEILARMQTKFGDLKADADSL